MTAYHQLGHDSTNLLGTVAGFGGAIISPVNLAEQEVASVVAKHAGPHFEFVFDPQFYFPRRADRGQLGTWSYFPKDFETADASSREWWTTIVNEVAATAARVGARAVCSPSLVVPALSNAYYEAMRANADALVEASAGLRVLETVIVRLSELGDPQRSMEIASVVSGTRASGIYLVLLSELKPRDEYRDVDQLIGAMRLINALENSGLPVLVGFSSSDVILWKAAGASSCASGKFANLRRFTAGRFNDPDEGGRQVAYWFEEALLAFLRTSDLLRVQRHGIAINTANPFGNDILAQIKDDPAKAWVALGWRQYLHWFADIEGRLATGATSSRDLVRAAERSWQLLEDNDVFMEERTNDGSWLRPWLRAIVEFAR